MKLIRLLCFFLCFSPGVLAQGREPAHVIIIMADQLRVDALGDLTPNINSLRAGGVSFNSTYCASPICVPSRASFFTGLYPNRTGSIINGWEESDKSSGVVAPGIPNLYALMEDKWDSWHVGKQHFFTSEKIDEGPNSKTRWITQEDYSAWVKQRGAKKPGGSAFRAMVPEMVSGRHTHTRTYSIPVVGLYKDGVENFLDHYIANESVAAIKKRDIKRPFLLNAMFLAPHPPFHIPDPYFSMIDAETVILPENVGKWYGAQSPLQLYNLPGFLGTRYTREEWRAVWAKYLGLVKLLDDEVGRILTALKEEGMYESSLIVFTADHGEMLGSHSLWQKMCMYEESSRVPLIIKFPAGVNIATKDVHVPVSLVDVLPTILEYNKLTVPANLDGQSLLPMVLSKGNQGRQPVFIQYDGNGSLGNFQRCLVSGEYKLIVDIFKDETFLEVYNLKEDPQETVNLAFRKEHREKTIALLTALRDVMARSGDRFVLPSDLYADFMKQYQNIIQK